MEGDKLTLFLERDGKRYQLVAPQHIALCKECAFKEEPLGKRCPRNEYGTYHYCTLAPYGIWKEVKE